MILYVVKVGTDIVEVAEFPQLESAVHFAAQYLAGHPRAPAWVTSDLLVAIQTNDTQEVYEVLNRYRQWHDDNDAHPAACPYVEVEWIEVG